MRTNSWARIGTAMAILTGVIAISSACVSSPETETPYSGNTPTTYEQTTLIYSPTVTEIVTTPTSIPTFTLTEQATATSTASATEAPVVIPDYLQEIPLVTAVPTTEAGLEKITVKIEDILSGAFAAAIKKAYFEGRIKPIPDGARPIHPNLHSKGIVGYDLGSMYNDYGFFKASERPDRFFGMFVGTNESGQKVLYIPQILKVGDSKNDIGVLIYEKDGDRPSIFNQLYRNYSSPNYNRLVVPVLLDSVKGCSYDQSEAAICPNYYVTDYPKVAALVKQWSGWQANEIDPAEFPEELETIPIVPY